ncbi:uncharacterized protein LOC115219174 [Argonauta hians]
MNYFLLLSAAVCCLFYETQAYKPAQLNAVCKEKFLKDGTIAGIQPHPFRCDAFLSCVPSHRGFKAIEKGCALKLMFDSRYSACNWASLVTCDQACKDGDKFKGFNACDTYFECTNSKFNPEEKKCAPGNRFDAKSKACVTDASCGDPVPPAGQACNVNYKIAAVPGTYEQKDNGIWKPKACPKNLGFSMTTCKCSENLVTDCPGNYKADTSDPSSYFKLENNNYVKKSCAAGERFSLSDCGCHLTKSSGKCSTIEIPFSSDTSDTHKSYVHNEKVTISGGYGVFDGTGYLTLPSTNNNDYGDNFEVKFTFNAENSKPDDKVALFGNYRCNDPGTFKVFLRTKTNPAMFSIIIQFQAGSTLKRDAIIRKNINTDYTLKITKQGPAFKVYLDGVETISKTYPGKLAPNKCSYGIGNLKSKSNFKGKIKDFHFSKCLL